MQLVLNYNKTNPCMNQQLLMDKFFMALCTLKPEAARTQT